MITYEIRMHRPTGQYVIWQLTTTVSGRWFKSEHKTSVYISKFFATREDAEEFLVKYAVADAANKKMLLEDLTKNFVTTVYDENGQRIGNKY